MSLTINTNVASLNAQRILSRNDGKLTDSLSRLSSGLRINSAADNASGMTIADSLKAQYSGIEQAIDNANDGISMVETADGALEESIDIVNTIKTKATQAASDSQTTETRTAIQKDIDALMEELDTIAKTTSFNGQKLLSGVFTNKEIQTGANAGETTSLSIDSTESAKIGQTTTATLGLASDAGGEVQLTITSSITGEDVKLNSVDIQYNNDPANGMGALADEINKYTSETGVSAVAVVESTTSQAISAGSTDSAFAINGVTIGAITVEDNDNSGSLVSAINGKSTETGVTASMNSDGTMTLTSDGRAIEISGSVSNVFGSNGSQLSTLGHIELTQSGTAEFQISGIGAGATGTDIDISGNTITVTDSKLAAGSTLLSGSKLSAGSTLGGDVTTATNVDAQTDFEISAGSTLASGTTIDSGSTLGGMVTSNADATTEADMFVSKGSTLESGTILEAGSIVTTGFTVGSGATAVTYDVGDELTSKVTLDGDLTLQSDMTLKKGSTLESGSKLAAGTELGVDITTSGATTLASDMTLEAGSTLASGSKLLSGTTVGAEITTATNTNTYETTELTAGSTIASGSTMAEGSTIGANTTTSADATLDSDMTVKAGSTLESGTILKAGTVISQDFTDNSVDYEAGDVLTSDTTLTADLTLSEDMTIAEGSTLESGSILSINTSNAGTVGLSDTEFKTLSDINVLTQEGAEEAISIANSALKDLDGIRSGLGSVQNQLSSTISNLQVTSTNLQSAESTIRNVDFSKETSNYSSLNLLAQTGTYALAQSNASTQNLLSLLQ